MALSQENPKITQSNSLIEASYDLSLTEKRLLIYCIAQIKKGVSVTPETDFKIHYYDFIKTFDLSKGSYANIRKAANRLYERSVVVPLYPESGQVRNPTKNIKKFRWVTSITLDDKQACVVLKFSEELIPYLQELEQQFTIYNLEDVVSITSEHAIRIYEFACQWKNKRQIRLELDWIREKLEIKGKYEQPRDMRRFIIEPAMKQINATTPLNIDYEMVKTGRRITHIDLKIMDKRQPLSKRLGLGGK